MSQKLANFVRYVVYLHHHMSFIIFYVFIFMLWFRFGKDVWLIANIAWMINEYITWICGSNSRQNQIIFFLGTLKYCLSSSSCSNWCYPFFFWHIINNVLWVFLLPVVSFTPSNSAVFSFYFSFVFFAFALVFVCILDQFRLLCLLQNMIRLSFHRVLR